MHASVSRFSTRWGRGRRRCDRGAGVPQGRRRRSHGTTKSALARARWSLPVSDEEAYRRAGGRRAYNAWRKTLVALRRQRLVELLQRSGRSVFARGTVRWLAGELGVSRRTVYRDLDAVFGQRAEREARRCPICGAAGSSETTGPPQSP